MRKFIIKAVLFAALQAVALAMLVATCPVDKDSYLRATRDKHSLLDKAPPPRIIFAGGSSVSFGIDSEAVKQHTPYNPVNMGLHVYLGLQFILTEATECLKKGDVLVLSIEYVLLDRVTTHREMVDIVLDHRRKSASYIGPDNIKPFMDNILAFVIKKADAFAWRHVMRHPKKAKKPYSRSSFNSYGDVIAHRSIDAERISGMSSHVYYRRGRLDKVIDRLNRLHAEVAGRGASVYFFYPPVPVQFHEKQKTQIEMIDLSLRDRMTIPILNSPSEMAYSEEMFYDSIYHLNWEGTVQRTKQIIERVMESQRKSFDE